MLAAEVLALGPGLALTRSDQGLVRFFTCSDGAEALHSWRQWKREHPLDAASFAEMRMLPAAALRLVELGADDADLGRMQGLARYFWLWTQRATRASVESATALAERGVEVVALKGLALHALGAMSPVERPITDGDLLLSAGLEPVAGLLRSRGFRVQRRQAHAWTAARGEREEIDLHRFPLHQDRRSRQHTLASATGLPNAPWRVPSPADLVLHACLHGVRRTSSPGWVLDVRRIVARFPVDWSELVERARARRFALILCDTLRVVADVLPPAVLAALEGSPVTGLEALEYARIAAGSGPWHAAAGAAAHTLRGLRATHARLDDELMARAAQRGRLQWRHGWASEWQRVEPVRGGRDAGAQAAGLHTSELRAPELHASGAPALCAPAIDAPEPHA